jgi:hypothetical protein
MLNIGWASENITPDKPAWLCGYAARSKPSGGVHDPLFAKACYINDGKTEAVLIACDLIGLCGRQLESIREKILSRCGVHNVILGATHTHSGPTSCPQLEWEEGAVDVQWMKEMEEKAAAAAINAKNSASPSTLFAGFVSVPEVTKNRRKGETEIDNELGVLWAKDSLGKIKGIIVNYACHCTVLDSSNYLISADYPGYIYQGVEDQFPGAAVLFFNGACGNLNIGYSADASALGVDMGDLRSYGNAKKMAGFILNGIQRAMDLSCRLEPELTFRNIPLEFPCRENLPSVQSLLDERRRIENSKTKSADDATKLVYIKSLLKNVEVYCKNGETKVTGENAIMSIGNAFVITIPGELFCEIGKQIKSFFRPDRLPLVFGYSNGYVGYLPTKKAFLAGGYECETGVHGPETEEYLLKAIKKAAGEI